VHSYELTKLCLKQYRYRCFLRGYTDWFILRILKNQYILIIQNQRCIKCVIICIVFKLYSGHVINKHQLFKYNKNIGTLKKLNASVHLIIQMHQSVIFSIHIKTYELYKHQNRHKIQAHWSCIQQNGNLGNTNHNRLSEFVSYVSTDEAM